MQCTLLIPHLAWPLGMGATQGDDRDPPHLQTLMSRAQHQPFPQIGWEAWLCQAFEVERQRDWPVAPLTLTIDGTEPGDGYWLRADPVHIRMHRNQLLLADASTFAVSLQEAQALAGSLYAHFEPEGLHFSAPHASRWYLRIAADPEVATSSLDDAVGEVIDHHLPAGPHALEWHRILNEAQMLLHGHAINEARETRGELAINGVWFWGGGRHPPVQGRHFAAVAANEVLAVALAAHADVPCVPLPHRGAEWLASTPTGDREARHLLVLDALTIPARRGDREAWRLALQALDAQWISPLIEALKAGRITEIVLVAPAPAACHRFELRRRDLLRFWRVLQPIARLLDAPSPTQRGME